MIKYDSEVADARQALQPVLQNIKELKRKVRNLFASASMQICFDKITVNLLRHTVFSVLGIKSDRKRSILVNRFNKKNKNMINFVSEG